MRLASIVRIYVAKGRRGPGLGRKEMVSNAKSKPSFLPIFLGKQCHTETCESIIGIFTDACHRDLSLISHCRVAVLLQKSCTPLTLTFHTLTFQAPSLLSYGGVDTSPFNKSPPQDS